jgi:hypothetical protein
MASAAARATPMAGRRLNAASMKTMPNPSISAVRGPCRGHEHVADVVGGPLREIVNVAQHSNAIGDPELARESVQSLALGSCRR